MEEFEQEVPVAEQKSPGPGEATDQAAEVAGEALDGAVAEQPDESEGIEAEIEETLTRAKIISRLKAIVIELEGGSLVVDGVSVDELADAVDFELEYSVKDGKRELEIELEW
jgi:amphi-Trp domain-containing protein